jgi:putative ABC transport system permease protein
MNLFYLVWQYLKAKPLNTLLNVVLLGMGIAVITIMLLANVQLQRRIEDDVKGIDLVIGAKGSPMQLILSSIFHVDVPTGNVKLFEAERFAKGPFVKQSIPLALGDNYKTFRIVGTSRKYAELYEASLTNGHWWRNTMEVVIGSAVEARTGLKSGDHFSSAHGLTSEGHQHEEQPYEVTGVMAATGSVLDELILTNVESIWQVHDLLSTPDSAGAPRDSIPLTMRSVLVPSVMRGDSVKEITALLIQYRSAMGAVQLPRLVNANSTMQAASPAFETARLFAIVGAGADLLMAFAYLLVIIAAISIFIALFNSLRERRYDMAIMRVMGASRSKLFMAIVLEGTILTMLGSLLGLVLGHLALMVVPLWMEQTQKAGITGWTFHPVEYLLLASSLLLGLLCSIIPAIQAYRTDISDVLAGNG